MKLTRTNKFFFADGTEVDPKTHYTTWVKVWELRKIGMELPGLNKNADIAVTMPRENVAKSTAERGLIVVRTIRYKINGSKHKCDSRCKSATGDVCECACGGANHGIHAR